MTSLLAAYLYLTAAQAHWAAEAFNLGVPYNVGYTFVSIIGAESSYCQAKVNGWSRGCSQLKRATARIFDPQVTRQQLTDDNERNLKDGLAYLLYCKAATKTWRRMVACFHWGLPHESQMSDAEIDSDSYVKAVSERVRQLQQVPISHI